MNESGFCFKYHPCMSLISCHTRCDNNYDKVNVAKYRNNDNYYLLLTSSLFSLISVKVSQSVVVSTAAACIQENIRSTKLND